MDDAAPSYRLAAIAAAACALLVPRAARAEEAIDYQAPAGCPDQSGFLSAAARKVPGAPARIADAGLVKVELRATPAGYTGVLERRPAGGSAPAARVLSAARCQDVVEALALTLALSLVPPEEPAVTIAAAPPAPVAPPSAGWGRLTVSLGLQAGRVIAGEPMLGAALALGLTRDERDEREARDDVRWWAVALEGALRLSWSRSDVARTPPRARFELMAAALEVCPVHALAGRARLGLCGVAEAGMLGGEGVGVAHPRWGRSRWLTLGGGTTLRVRLTQRWQVIAAGQLTRPLQPTRFVLAEPAEVVARTGALAFAGTLAVAARFP